MNETGQPEVVGLRDRQGRPMGAADEWARETAAAVLQSISDSEPDKDTIGAAELLEGTEFENLYFLVGHEIEDAVYVALSNAFYDGFIQLAPTGAETERPRTALSNRRAEIRADSARTPAEEHTAYHATGMCYGDSHAELEAAEQQDGRAERQAETVRRFLSHPECDGEHGRRRFSLSSSEYADLCAALAAAPAAQEPDPEAACRLCNRARREHRPGYSAQRCTFRGPAATPQEEPLPWAQPGDISDGGTVFVPTAPQRPVALAAQLYRLAGGVDVLPDEDNQAEARRSIAREIRDVAAAVRDLPAPSAPLHRLGAALSVLDKPREPGSAWLSDVAEDSAAVVTAAREVIAAQVETREPDGLEVFVLGALYAARGMAAAEVEGAAHRIAERLRTEYLTPPSPAYAAERDRRAYEDGRDDEATVRAFDAVMGETPAAVRELVRPHALDAVETLVELGWRGPNATSSDNLSEGADVVVEAIARALATHRTPDAPATGGAG